MHLYVNKNLCEDQKASSIEFVMTLPGQIRVMLVFTLLPIGQSLIVVSMTKEREDILFPYSGLNGTVLVLPNLSLSML